MTSVMDKYDRIECRRCDRTGWDVDARCPRCDGYGYRLRKDIEADHADDDDGRGER